MLPETADLWHGRQVHLSTRSSYQVIDRQRLTILARLVMLLLCAGLTFVESIQQEGVGNEAVARLMVLAWIAAMAVIAAYARPSAWWVPVAESGTVALLAMAGGGPHEALLPYLLAPALDAGLLAGAQGAISAVGTAAATMLVARIVDLTNRDVLDYSTTAAQWILLALSTGMLAAWARRLGVRPVAENGAYNAAYRLISQLRTVARQLSNGLDAPTLSQMLLQQLREKTAFERGAVFVSSGPALVPLVSDGQAPDWDTSLTGDGLLAEAWNHQRPAATGRGFNGQTGLSSLALPLTVGTRTIGVVAVERRGKWELAEPADELMPLVEEAALRIETALLFSEVRSIATADERRRLAREIHDGVAQELAFFGYMLDDLAARSTQPDVRAELVDLRGQVTRVVGDLRLSIFELRSDVQTDAGLGAALSDFVRSIGASSAMTVHLVLDESHIRLPVATETELLRIAQESVNNARKHAGAENLWVVCQVRPPAARLVIEDDGAGLGPGRADSYGLQIMQERAASLGATLSLTEREGGGTRVEVTLEGRRAAGVAGREVDRQL